MSKGLQEYREAVERERIIRDASFLSITETVGDFELVQMTLRQFLVLSLVGNPLIVLGNPTPIELIGFLWLLSPKYTPHFSFARLMHLIKCRRYKHATVQTAQLIGACKKYCDETFYDKSTGVDHRAKSYYSGCIGVVHVFASQYGWSEDYILDMPLKRIYQYLKRIQREFDPRSPLFNRSDKLAGDLAAQGAFN